MSGFRIPLGRPSVGAAELHAIKQVLDSGYLTEGPVTKAFEEEYAAFVNAPIAIATTSCSTALELALRVAGIGPGDEVIAPAFTYPITADVARLVGAEPVLVDVDAQTYNIDIDEISKAVTEKTKAIIPVSLFGQPLDIDSIRDKIPDGTAVIEDAACSVGASWNGNKTGSMADMTAFSLHPRKIVTSGEGGMLTLADETQSDLARSIKRFGMEFRDGIPDATTFVRPGNNWKLSDVLAAIGRCQLARADELLAERRQGAIVYDELLSDAGLEIPHVPQGAHHSYQTYAIPLRDKTSRDDAMQRMRNEGIEAQVGTYCLHTQPSFSNVRKIDKLRVSEKLAGSLLSLPLPHGLTQSEQQEVVSTLKGALEANR